MIPQAKFADSLAKKIGIDQVTMRRFVRKLAEHSYLPLEAPGRPFLVTDFSAAILLVALMAAQHPREIPSAMPETDRLAIVAGLVRSDGAAEVEVPIPNFRHGLSTENTFIDMVAAAIACERCGMFEAAWRKIQFLALGRVHGKMMAWINFVPGPGYTPGKEFGIAGFVFSSGPAITEPRAGRMLDGERRVLNGGVLSWVAELLGPGPPPEIDPRKKLNGPRLVHTNAQPDCA